eukprot:scaffold238418_cov33-Tisochrysis_lutea.AAC.2
MNYQLRASGAGTRPHRETRLKGDDKPRQKTPSRRESITNPGLLDATVHRNRNNRDTIQKQATQRHKRKSGTIPLGAGAPRSDPPPPQPGPLSLSTGQGEMQQGGK